MLLGLGQRVLVPPLLLLVATRISGKGFKAFGVGLEAFWFRLRGSGG